LDGYDEAAFEAALNICRVSFNWPDERVAEMRPGMLERLRDRQFREKEMTYLARLDGQPAAFGRVQLQSGVAYLGGAATLPEFRSRKIYSTLLRRRLEEAHARGYHLAAINAEPLSRRIVAHYGF
jgi:GNAT superfamily N-acetyltransferase